MDTLKRPESSPRTRGRWGVRLLWAIPLALLLFVVVSDLFGWAYLRKPVAAFLSSKLGRQVEIDPPFSLHLRPSIPIRIGAVRVAAPDWSQQPHFAKVEGIEADVDWGVLVGRQPVLHRLAVARADVRAERDAQGRASWSMGAPGEPPEKESTGPMIPVIEQLSIGQANIDVKDAKNDLDLQLQATAGASGIGGIGGIGGGAGGPQPGAGAPRPVQDSVGLVVTGAGRWKSEPLSLDLRTRGSEAALKNGVLSELDVKGKLGGTQLTFNGGIPDLARLDVTGKVSAEGPSLARFGAIPGVTLPETPPYRLEADVQRAGSSVKVNVSRAEVGSSSMKADLTYDGGAPTPTLRGSVSASRLVLQDLGPSIGTTSGASPDKGSATGTGGGSKVGSSAKGADNKSAAGRRQGADRKPPEGKPGGKPATGKEKSAQKPSSSGGQQAGRVLPSKEFDLPSLRAMNADVAIDLQKLDLGTEALRPLTSLKSRLLLEGGVLRLQDLKSDLAGGTVTGSTVLDGSSPDAAPAFDARLNWNRVDLKNWVAVSADYFVAGRFSGETLLKGSGKSTAAILESLTGSVRGHIDGGSISHTLVELAGLDAAQALGVFFSGDRPLKLSCALVDMTADKGNLRTNVFVLNTPDTVFFVQGGVNFRNERLDLRLVQAPKDWSPLSLRSPVTVGGTFSDPAIGVEPAPIALKLLGSAALAAVTPLAALLPFIELGESEAREGCAPAIVEVRKRAADGAPAAATAEGRSRAAPADEGKPAGRQRDPSTPRRPGRPAGERP